MANGRRTVTGRWYYVITIVSMGMLAWVPFLHAAQRLARPRLRLTALAYGVVVIGAYVVFGAAPLDDTGTPTGWTSDVSLGVILVAIVVACLQQQPLRAAVYRDPNAPVPPGAESVERVRRARALRAEARELAQRDPLMARELRIGRPDLPSTYDDGGLVDLNSAPAAVIAQGCDIPAAVAEQIVSAREAIHGFSSIEEALVYAELTGSAADLVRDRGLVLPR